MKKSVTKFSKPLVFLSALMLSSCTGGFIGGDSGDNSGIIAGTTIKIMFHVDSKSAEGIAYKKRVDEFNKQYKDKYKAAATFKARTAGAADYGNELLSLKKTDSLPSIITFDAPNCHSYAKSGILLDITDLMDKATVSDFVSTSTYQNKLYGLPIQESSAGFFYNKQIFASAGIDVSAYTVENPWTFEQFKQVCAKLRTANPGNDFTPVDMRLDATKDETAPYLLYSFGHAAGGKFLSDDGLHAQGYLNSTEINRGFSFIKELYTANYTSYAVGATDFFTGKAGMYLSSGWTIPDLDYKYESTFGVKDRTKWGVLPYPKDVKAASATGSWCFGLTQNKIEDKTGAIELLKFMTSVESSKAITDATGMIPARKSVEDNYEVNSPEYVLRKQLEVSGIERPATIGYPQFSTVFNQIISEMKNSDIAGILNTKAASLESHLAEINR